MRNKRGSTSVFLTVILASMIALTLMYIRGAMSVATMGYSDAVLNLAGRSVLSEFNVKLKDDYGILAFKGSSEDIERKLSYYANYTFDKNNYINMKSVSVNNDAGCLINTNVFEKEVVDYSRYAMARGIIKDGHGEKDNGVVSSSESNRTLRNKKVLQDLPSEVLGPNGGTWKAVIDGLSDTGKVFEKGTDNFFVNRYIMTMFKNLRNQSIDRESFFNYEIEYILCGDKCDLENKSKYRNKLLLIRNAPNLIFIYADPVKKAELLAAAMALTPGPQALITQIALAEAWALAEAENDVRLLEDGKLVPIYKTPLTWAVDIQSIIDNVGREGYIDTKSPTGLSYEGYMEISLFFMERNTKLVRAMDLIQINMQGSYDKAFRVRDYNAGFDFKSEVNGKNFRYGERY